jgi:hypothetical protein
MVYLSAGKLRTHVAEKREAHRFGVLAVPSLPLPAGSTHSNKLRRLPPGSPVEQTLKLTDCEARQIVIISSAMRLRTCPSPSLFSAAEADTQ